MSGSILIVGLGAVGANAARQLLDTPGVSSILVADERREQMQRVLGALASPRVSAADIDALPRDVDAVICAVPDDDDVALAEFAIANGIAFASATDDADGITQLLSS